MKLLRPRTFVIFAFVALSGAVLLHTSQNVQHAEERLAVMERSVYQEREKIRMLRAEWELLNRPERLEKLANEFLDLVPPAPDQMATDTADALPEYEAPELQEVQETYQGESPIFQNVSMDADEKPTPPVPTSKPYYKKPIAKPVAPEAPPQNLNSKTKEKDFGDLINELGGDQ